MMDWMAANNIAIKEIGKFLGPADYIRFRSTSKNIRRNLPEKTLISKLKFRERVIKVRTMKERIQIKKTWNKMRPCLDEGRIKMQVYYLQYFKDLLLRSEELMLEDVDLPYNWTGPFRDEDSMEKDFIPMQVYEILNSRPRRFRSNPQNSIMVTPLYMENGNHRKSLICSVMPYDQNRTRTENEQRARARDHQRVVLETDVDNLQKWLDREQPRLRPAMRSTLEMDWYHYSFGYAYKNITRLGEEALAKELTHKTQYYWPADLPSQWINSKLVPPEPMEVITIE